VWLGEDGWTASRPTHESEIRTAAFGEGDLIGTVGPATLPAEEVVRRWTRWSSMSCARADVVRRATVLRSGCPPTTAG
jgi:hypothetical protein